jgi:hypothetical protein
MSMKKSAGTVPAVSPVTMRIGIVGGAERIEARLRTVALARGHQLEFHAGHMSGTGARRLEAIIERCDLLLVVTDVNSHTAVLQAREMARRSGRALRLVRRLGTAQLRALLN